MTYKDSIKRAMNKLAKDKRVVFIGYNTACGSRMYGTLSGVPKSRCIETPVAENLMIGLAMGMSLEGYRPVVCFERMDFLWAAGDAIVNHLDKLPELSHWQFHFSVMIRAVVGNDTPLDPGIQHKGKYYSCFNMACSFPVMHMGFKREEIYKFSDDPVMIIEDKHYYNKEAW